MKRLFIVSTLLLSFCQMPFAASLTTNTAVEPEGPTLVIIYPDLSGENSEHGEASRAPIRIPSLYIEDHTLSFSSACVGYTLELIQDGETVYSISITDTDDLVLPDYLCGQFEIRLVGASFTFVGEIEL